MNRGVSLTRRGWSLLGAAGGLVVGSFLLGAIELLALALTAIAMLAGSTLWLTFRRSPDLAMTRRARPERLHVGSDGRIDLIVENRGTRGTPLLSATDWFDEGRRAARFLVPPLAAGAVGRAAYRIPTRRRGRYQVGPLIVRVTDPFGLARRSLATVEPTEVLIRPRVHDIVAPVAIGSRVTGDTEALSARAMVSDLGDEFLTLRDYELGDDLRRVHWRSTARTGELMIRQDEARWRSQAAVILDVHPDGHDEDSFEVAVEAAASVVARLVRLQRRVEVITSSGEILGTGGDPRHNVIDRLATVGFDASDRLATVLENLRAHRRVDLVVAVLGRVGPDVTRAIGTLSGIDTIVVLTQPVAWTTTRSLVVVDATAAPFRAAWDLACTRARTGRGSSFGGSSIGGPSGGAARW